jgi:hypothetical protein
MRLAAYLRLKFLSLVRFSVFLAIFRGYSFRRFVLAPLRLCVRFSSRLFLRFFSLRERVPRQHRGCSAKFSTRGFPRRSLFGVDPVVEKFDEKGLSPAFDLKPIRTRLKSCSTR